MLSVTQGFGGFGLPTGTTQSGSSTTAVPSTTTFTPSVTYSPFVGIGPAIFGDLPRRPSSSRQRRPIPQAQVQPLPSPPLLLPPKIELPFQKFAKDLQTSIALIEMLPELNENHKIDLGNFLLESVGVVASSAVVKWVQESLKKK